MKQYDHKKIEKKWQKEWDKKKIYQVKDTVKGKENFYTLVEFTYPSGNLHVGHWYAFAVPDIFARYKRMQGFNVLYPMGFDAFGLPAENAAIKLGADPKEWTYKQMGKMREQLKSMGAMFPWDREIVSCDSEYYKWTQWMFNQFLKNDLVYRDITKVNWCPKDQTILANEQVAEGRCDRCGAEVEQRNQEQWMLRITKYADRLIDDLDSLSWPEEIKTAQKNWIGRSEGSEIDFRISSPVATPKQILIGTRNDAKFQMVKNCLPSLSDVEILSLNDIPEVDDSMLVEGPDFEENARMKAKFYFEKTGIPTLSTDNIFWVEKWPKDNGVIVHMRKEVNPKSDRASDEEVVAYFDKWITKNSDSKAHFIFGLAYANATGVQYASSTQREYILQNKVKKQHPEGYPMEAFLKDAKTGEYKCDQKDSVRYDKLIETLATEVKNWIYTEINIKVFTTRADTLFGVTYVVLAPEHTMVNGLLGKIENKSEVEKYIKDTKNKSELDRKQQKEKTGIELKGVKAINPVNGEEVPVWIADYVLAGYGTGAVMAVPAHDERDFEFAEKYKLPIKRVVEQKFSAADSPIRPELPIVYRNCICAIIRNPKDGKYLCSVWKNIHCHGLITGGIEEGEDMVEGALREIYEETGYKNVKLVNNPDITIHTFFYHRKKEENRWARFNYLFFDLIDEVQDPIDEKEAAIHDLVWKSKDELKNFFSVIEGEFLLNILDNKSYLYTGEGILGNSGTFNGMESEEARMKITKAVGGKMVNTYRLRDWGISRQRYWGTPIPIVYDPKGKAHPIPDKHLPWLLPTDVDHTPDGTSPLARSKELLKRTEKIFGKGWKPEVETMDTFVDSSWYFYRYLDNKNKKIFADVKRRNAWMPIDLYMGGAEHTTMHLLYSRFWVKAMYDLGLVKEVEAYKVRRNRGLILGPDGNKMSKSKGNVIDPDEIVDRLGADTVRMYLAFMGPYGVTVNYPWDPNGVVGVRRFLERVWRLKEKVGKGNTTPFLHKVIKKMTDDIEEYKFNTAIAQMMMLLNEWDKVDVILEKEYKMLLQILAPFAPHITEEIFYELGEKKSIHLSSWPKWDKKNIVDDSIKIAVQVNGKVRNELVVPSDASEEEIKELALKDKAIISWTEGKEIKRVIYVKGRLVNIVV